MIKKSHLHVSRTPAFLSDWPTTQKEFVNEQVEKDGRIVTRLGEKIVDRKDQFANFRASDFSLGNQIAVGSIKNARPVTLSGSSLENDNANVERLETYLNEVSSNSNGSNVE